MPSGLLSTFDPLACYTSKMITAPQQNWALYGYQARPIDAAWARGLTPSERFDIYGDFFDSIDAARAVLSSSERLERWSWEQKLATRLHLVEAFTKRDQLHRERTASRNAD